MSQQYEDTFSIEESALEPALSHHEVTSVTVSIVLSQSTTYQNEEKPNTVISLGIPENESLSDANKDMDRLGQQCFEDMDK